MGFGDSAGALGSAGRSVAVCKGAVVALEAHRPAKGGNIGRSSVMMVALL